MKHIWLILLLSLSLFSCQKDNINGNNQGGGSSGGNDNNPIDCGINADELKVDENIYSLNNTTTVVNTAGNFTSVHQVDSVNGISLEFGGSIPPTSGFYTITNNVTTVEATNKNVYVRYFKNNQGFTAQQGIVEVRDINGVLNSLGCDVLCTAAGSNDFLTSWRSSLN